MRLLILVFLFASSVCLSQTPQAFKYQALIRDKNRHAAAEEEVAIRITILQGSIEGTAVYSEQHDVTTNAFGMVNLEVGRGTILNGEFAGISWGSDAHFIKVEMDVDRDGQFEDSGTSEMLSVPYALQAGSVSNEKWSGDENINRESGNVGIGKSNPGYKLDVNGSVNAGSFLINGTPLVPGHWTKSGTNLFYNSGNVGINMATPAERLHLGGSIRGDQQGGALRVNTEHGWLDVGAKNADYAHFYTAMPYGFYFGGGPVTVNEQLIGYKATDFHLSTQSPNTFQPVKRLSIKNSNGYVGIGNTDPQYNLDVNGTINASSILVNGNPFTLESLWSLSGSDVYYSTGNVGIGTDEPQEKLHINGNIRGNQQGGALRVQTEYGHIDIGATNADYAHFRTLMPYGFYFGGGPVTVNEQLIGYKLYDLHLSTQSNSDFQPEKRVTILNSNGYVGIGTTSPNAKLEVESGDIYLNSATAGVIMKSPDGNCWKLTVGNDGAPVFTAMTCPE